MSPYSLLGRSKLTWTIGPAEFRGLVDPHLLGLGRKYGNVLYRVGSFGLLWLSLSSARRHAEQLAPGGGGVKNHDPENLRPNLDLVCLIAGQFVRKILSRTQPFSC